MTREELMESAALDALGLLDDYETALYTRSFHHAPAVVQDEIIAMQADIATDERLLPGATPDPKLRDRVLGAVADAIERETAELEPLAIIGRPRHPDADVIGVIQNGSTARFWRAAAFVLSGVVIVLAYFATVSYHYGIRISELAMNSRAQAELRAMIGEDWADFVSNPDCNAFVLRPAKSDFPGIATIYVNTKTNDVYMLGIGIPAASSEVLTLAIRAADGSVLPQRTFSSDGSVIGLRMDQMDVALLANATWQITNSAGAVILSNA